MKIKFNTFAEVNKFVGLAASINGSILIKSGRYVIDGRSILGIFSLDLSKVLELEVVEKADGETTRLMDELRELGILVE